MGRPPSRRLPDRAHIKDTAVVLRYRGLKVVLDEDSVHATVVGPDDVALSPFLADVEAAQRWVDDWLRRHGQAPRGAPRRPA